VVAQEGTEGFRQAGQAQQRLDEQRIQVAAGPRLVLQTAQ
jgi:hypothetical protein